MNEEQAFDSLGSILSKAVVECHTLLARFTFAPRTKSRKAFALFLLVQLNRKCESVQAMARANADAGIEIVTRAALENHVDLLNLLRRDEAYLSYMKWLECNHWRSSLEAASKDAVFRRYVPDLAGKMSTVSKNMEHWRRCLPSTYKDKNGNVYAREIFRFELADKRADYDRIYRPFSAHTHGRLSSIIAGSDHRPTLALSHLCDLSIESSLLVARKYEKPDGALRRLREHLDATVADMARSLDVGT